MKQASNEHVLISALLTTALIRGSYGLGDCSIVEGTPHFNIFIVQPLTIGNARLHEARIDMENVMGATP